MYTVHKKDKIRLALDEKKLDELNRNGKVSLGLTMNGKSDKEIEANKIIDGVDNLSYINDDSILKEAIEIVKDLPTLNVEHCKL